MYSFFSDVFFLAKSILAYSGHYKPSTENLNNFMKFLQESGVDLKEVKVHQLVSDPNLKFSYVVVDGFIIRS